MKRARVIFCICAIAVGSACEDNTTCDTGTLICTDPDGEVAQVEDGGDAQLRECVGTADGGDEDGEFVVVEDCAADGNACNIEFIPGANVERGNCISRACADDPLADCVELGSTRCLFDGVATCSLDATDDCNHYVVTTECVAPETCSDADATPSCGP